MLYRLECIIFAKKLISMEALSVTNLRNNLASTLDRADRGDRVLIRRRNNIYALVNIGKEDLMITPELQKRIDKARQDFKEGKTLHFDNAEAAIKWMDEL